jgi:hypothetical protein
MLQYDAKMLAGLQQMAVNKAEQEMAALEGCLA